MRKKIAVVLAFAMMVTGICGCGRKNVEYGGNETSESKQKEEISNGNLDVGNSGLNSIKVSEGIKVNTSGKSYNVVHFKKNSDTSNLIEKIIENVIDEGTEVYDVSNGGATKSDNQLFIEPFKRLLELEKEAGNTEGINECENMIQAMLNDMEELPDTLDIAQDYDGSAYRVTYNEFPYYLYSYDVGTENNEQKMIELSPYGDTYLLRPKEGTSSLFMEAEDTISFMANSDFETKEMDDTAEDKGDYWIDEDGNVNGIQNSSEMTVEEAKQIALDYFAKLGITDIESNKVYNMVWQYYGAGNEIVANEVDGYVINLRRNLGAKIFAEDLSYVSSLSNAYGDSAPEILYDYFTVKVFDGRVIALSMCSMYEEPSAVDENVDILSLNEIMEKANVSIADYYTQYPTKVTDLEFDEVDLQYMLVSDGEEAVKFEPVYVFAMRSGEDVREVVILDAITGEWVNIAKEQLNAGAYEFIIGSVG